MRSLGIERVQFDGRNVEVELAVSSEPAPVELVTTGFTLAFDGDRVLLVRLADRDWHPPGGHRELGETPREAAMREAMEESGCRVEGLAPLGWQRLTSHDPVPDGWTYPVPTAYQQFFVGIVDGAAARPGTEAVDARLFAPDEARALRWVQRHRGLYEEALRRALAFDARTLL